MAISAKFSKFLSFLAVYALSTAALEVHFDARGASVNGLEARKAHWPKLRPCGCLDFIYTENLACFITEAPATVDPDAPSTAICRLFDASGKVDSADYHYTCAGSWLQPDCNFCAQSGTTPISHWPPPADTSPLCPGRPLCWSHARGDMVYAARGDWPPVPNVHGGFYTADLPQMTVCAPGEEETDVDH
ncbi:MAG: hypothetical protein Q9227_002147 [Pyrenula ochraceoflavens]